MWGLCTAAFVVGNGKEEGMVLTDAEHFNIKKINLFFDATSFVT